jgi:hypothetical protein
MKHVDSKGKNDGKTKGGVHAVDSPLSSSSRDRVEVIDLVLSQVCFGFGCGGVVKRRPVR